MPELPEVEVFRRYFNETSLHQKIKKVEVESLRMLKETEPGFLQERLKNKTFKSTSRIGKYLLAEADKKNCLVLHFGMTGSLKYFKSMEETPKHTKLLISFSNGFHLAFDDPRTFGSIRLVDNPDEFSRIKNLGPDALSKNLDLQAFIKKISGRSGTIKAELMDQQNIAGIGNIYSDEILFHSGIDPRRSVKDISLKDLKQIYKNMVKTLNTVINADADFPSLGGKYLLHYRKAGSKCPICGNKIKMARVGGRSSYFCSKHQK